jgi:hypothetical protein
MRGSLLCSDRCSRLSIAPSSRFVSLLPPPLLVLARGARGPHPPALPPHHPVLLPRGRTSRSRTPPSSCPVSSGRRTPSHRSCECPSTTIPSRVSRHAPRPPLGAWPVAPPSHQHPIPRRTRVTHQRPTISIPISLLTGRLARISVPPSASHHQHPHLSSHWASGTYQRPTISVPPSASPSLFSLGVWHAQADALLYDEDLLLMVPWDPTH